MKSPLIIIAVAVTGFSAGMFAAREFSDAPGGGAESTTPTTPGPEQAGKRRNDPVDSKGKTSPSEGKHDFATLVRNSRRILSKFSPVNRELERMDAGELKALVMELAVSLQAEGSSEEQQAAYSVQRAVATELYQREGTGALDWAAGIQPGEGGREILSVILSEVTKELPETGKEWIEKYRGELGDEWARNFVHQAIIGANGRRAADVLRVMELFKNDMRGIALNQGTYAEDFDFHRLITTLPPGFELGETVSYWAARDKEAAWAGVEEVIKTSSGQSGGSYFGSLFQGIVTLEGDEKATAWTVRKLELIPPETRERALRSLVMYPLPGETVATLVKALPGESDRVFLASELVQPFRPASALGALRALGSENLQARALVRAADKQAGYAAHGNFPSNETLGFFATTMDQLQFTPASRQKVEAALPHN